MKLSRAILCLIVMLGLSNVEASSKCHIGCAPAAQREGKDCEGMEQLGVKCQSVGDFYKKCMKRCGDREQERENEAKNEKLRQNLLKKEKLRQKGQKH